MGAAQFSARGKDFFVQGEGLQKMTLGGGTISETQGMGTGDDIDPESSGRTSV